MVLGQTLLTIQSRLKNHSVQTFNLDHDRPSSEKSFSPFRFLALLGLSLPFLGFVPPEKQWEGGEGA